MLTIEDYKTLNSVKFNLLDCANSIRKYVTIITYNRDGSNTLHLEKKYNYCYTKFYGKYINVFYLKRGVFPQEFYIKAIDLYFYLLENYLNAFLIANRIINNMHAKRVRLKKFINQMLDNSTCLFLTFTFTDYYLKSTSHNTRRRYIQRFLKSYNTNAVANVDYGSKKHREHYHAIIEKDYINSADYKYGNLDFVKVNYNGVTSVKLTRYITKLTYHALKKSTKNKDNLMYIHKK